MKKEMENIIKDTEHCFIMTEKGLYIKGSPVVIAKQTVIKMLQLKEFKGYMGIYLEELKQFFNDFKEILDKKDDDRK